MDSGGNLYQAPDANLVIKDEMTPKDVSRYREIRNTGRFVFYFLMFLFCFSIEMFAVHKKGGNSISVLALAALVVFIFYAILSLPGLYLGDRIGKVVFNSGWLSVLTCSLIGGIAWGGYSGFISQILGSVLSLLIVAIDAPLRSLQVVLEHMCYSWTYVTFVPIPLSIAASVVLRLMHKQRMDRQKRGVF